MICHVLTDGRVDGCRSNNTVHVMSCEHSEAALETVYVNEYYHEVKGDCPYCGLSISNKEEHSYDSVTHKCVCGVQGHKVTVEGVDEAAARITLNEDTDGCQQDQ